MSNQNLNSNVIGKEEETSRKNSDECLWLLSAKGRGQPCTHNCLPYDWAVHAQKSGLDAYVHNMEKSETNICEDRAVILSKTVNQRCPRGTRKTIAKIYRNFKTVIRFFDKKSITLKAMSSKPSAIFARMWVHVQVCNQAHPSCPTTEESWMQSTRIEPLAT